MPDSSSPAPALSLKHNGAGQGLMLTTMAMLAFGVVMVCSVMVRAVPSQVEWYNRTDVRDAFYAAVSGLVLMTCWRIDYHVLAKGRLPWLALIALAVSVVTAALVYVPGIGIKVGKYARWVRLGPLGTFQPSELIKITLLVFLAAWLGTKTRPDVRSFWKTFLPACGIIGVVVGVVTIEDFSTGAILALAAGVTLLLAGVPWYYLASLLPVAAGGFYKFVYANEYRWPRMQAWMNPWELNNKSAFQVRESLMALITGDWRGKGLGMGTIKLGHLPEASTDFIFAIVGEELGFIGALIVVGLVAIWIWQARKAAARAGDSMGMLLAASLGFLLAIQSVLHIAVALAAAPTTGMGLPFISAGGTALVFSAAAAAMMISVTAHAPRQDIASNP